MRNGIGYKTIMSENYTENEDFSTEEELQETEASEAKDRKWVRDLEKRAKGAEQAKAEADAAKRELAFLKAGIDTDTPQGKLFQKAYDGEFSVDAVRKAAEEYGVLAPIAPEIPAAELDALDRVSRAGATSSNAGLVDPLALMENAESPAEIIEILKKQGVVIDNEQPGQWKSLV